MPGTVHPRHKASADTGALDSGGISFSLRTEATSPLETLEALQEFADLDGHCEFLQGVLLEHAWQDKAIAIRFESLLKEKNDPRLVLGIVGEFSSGKSTLVNALLRADILETSVTQATTCALTFVHFRPQLSAEVVFKDGTPSKAWSPPRPPRTFGTPSLKSSDASSWFAKLVKWIREFFGRAQPVPIPVTPPVKQPNAPNPQDSLRDFLRLYTATESTATNVLQVNLGYPFPALKNGLHILDTPGTNAANKRHLKVTADALQNVCHSALIVIPADAPCAQTLMDFVQATLANRKHRCIFLITKLDLVRPKEREKQVRYITAVLKRELELEKLTILTASPRFVIDGLSSAMKPSAADEQSFAPEDVAAFLREYESAERGIQDHLKRNKLQILLESLLNNMSGIMAGLSDLLTKEQEILEERRGHLEKTRIKNLDKFVSEQKDLRIKNFRATTQSVLATFKESIEALRTNVLKDCTAEIEKATSKDELRSIAITRSKYWLSFYETELQRLIQWLTESCSVQESAELATVASGFTTLYQNLTALEANPHNPRGFSEAVRSTLARNASTLTNFSVRVGEKLPENIFLKAWNVFFGPNLEELRQQIQRDVRVMVSDVLDDYDRDAGKFHLQMHFGITEHIGSVIDGYSTIYRDTVAAMISEHFRMEREIAERARRTVALKDEIMRRRHKVEQTLAHLVSL